ncbi:MAG: ASKHA domain-containing protein [Ignavibacteriales bacterium]
MNDSFIKITVIENEYSTEYEVSQGDSVLQALKSLGFFIPAVCGGIGKCGKCKVKVSMPISIDINEDERKHLDEQEIKNGIRLACHIPAVNGMKIWIGGPFEKAEQTAPIYSAKHRTGKIGAAVDIGTTTIVLSIINLVSGELISTESAMNPQIANGADVISRIAYVESNPSKLKEMQGLVVSAVNWLISLSLKSLGLKESCISKMVVSGNTVMLHMFLGFDVQSLGVYPYQAKNIGVLIKNGEKIGLNIAKDSEVLILPCISAFLGADIVSGLLETRLFENEKMSILLDIGTNGEIVAGNKSRMVGCSTAAGPAFEGASIRCGSINVKGAIDKVFLHDGDVEYSTIGNIPPKSICGSGIIDMTAVLLQEEIIQLNGRMISADESANSKVIEYKGMPAFLIARGENQVIFTQEDVRKVQLAKSAVITGINLIMKRLNIDYKDVDKLYIAGNFGTFLDINNAIKIGLIPEPLKDKIVIVGNSSIKGAEKCLIDNQLTEKCLKIQRQVEYYDIGRDKDFQEMFISNLNF